MNRLTPPINFDAAGRLDVDLLCAGCGHNLRGLLPTGACGECGRPVKWTLAGSNIGAADPAWLARVHLGAAMVACLLPWLWVPIVSPFFAWGLWQLTAADPGERGVGQTAMHVGFRPFLIWGLSALLPVAWLNDAELPPFSLVNLGYLVAGAYGLALLLAGSGIRRIGKRTRARGVATVAGLVAVAGLIGFLSWGLLIALQLLVSYGQIDAAPEDLVGTALVAGGVSYLAILPLMILLVVVWRILQGAEVEAHGLRHELKAWQGPTPGATWRAQAAASAGGAAATDCRAEA
jgi:hypothetical protein